MNKAKNIYIDAHTEPLKIVKSESERKIKIEFVNQDLKEAIKQMRTLIKNSSKKKLQFKKTQQQNVNPQKKEEANKVDDKMFFTETYKKKMETRLFEIEQRKKQLNARTLEKQMKARLQRKVNECITMKERIDLLRQIKQRRELMMNEKNRLDKIRKQEQKLLHQSNLMNADMLRKTKRKSHKRELQDSKCSQQQSLNDLKFKTFLKQKEKQQIQNMIKSRTEFINRCNSEKKFRKSLLSNQSQRNWVKLSERGAYTSHMIRKNGKTHKNNDQQELVVGEEGKNMSESKIEVSSTSSKVQRKYNSGVRQTQRNERVENEQNIVKNQEPQALEVENL